jgi:hypothetical protein
MDAIDDHTKITWTNVTTFYNNWTNQANAPVAKYGKDGAGNVYLKGCIAGGTIQAAAFTLPVGFRPAADETRVTSANSLFAMYVIRSNGNVEPWVGANSWYWLDDFPHTAS